MLVVTSESMVPPGGAFVAKHPDSGVVFRHHTVNGVWEKFNSHCRANNFAELTRQQVVENICENTRANICHDTDAPTLTQMVRTFAADMVEWGKAGLAASKAVAESRLEICLACPYWHGLSGGGYVAGRCGKCGCSGLKLAMHTTNCPIGKWSAVA